LKLRDELELFGDYPLEGSGVVGKVKSVHIRKKIYAQHPKIARK